MRQIVLSGSIVAALVLTSACGPRETADERQRDANTAAGKLGQAAHKAAVQADKAGRVIGKELQQAAHDAHEGWKQDAHKKSETSR